MHRVSMNTEQTRFDLAAMIQEWVDFLETQCGYEKADFALVAVLTNEHTEAFREMARNEGLDWDDLSGDFLVPDRLWESMQANGGWPYSLEVWDLIWSDCFQAVSDAVDYAEEQLHLEREHGLV